MRSLLLQCSIAIAALFVAIGIRVDSSAVAQPLDRSGAEALTATVVSADKSAIVVRTDDGSLVTFLLDGGAFVPDGLVAGTRVTIRYQVLDGGRYQAVRVGIASFPPEAGSTTAAPPVPPAGVPPLSPPATTPSVEPQGGGDSVATADTLVTPVGGRPVQNAPGVVPGSTGRDTSLPPSSAASGGLPAAVAAPTSGDFVTLAAVLLVAVGLLGLAFVLERR
jgi:hypothetical protein